MYPFIPSVREVEEVRETISKLSELVESELRRSGAKFDKIVAGGSTAKGTFLSGDTDIDLFIVTENTDEVFEIVKKIFPNGRRKMGELKIWNFKYGRFDVDLVVVNPELSERWFTLQHTEIYSKMSENQKNTVRILKALFKSYACYGAENGGITGVAVEELVRRYTDPSVSPEDGAVKVCSMILQHQSPFWLQDPAGERVNVKRNLLASVYPEKWELIRRACSDYLTNRSFTYVKSTSDLFAKIRESEGWTVVKLPSTGMKDRDFMKGRSLCYNACKLLKSVERDLRVCVCDAYSDGREVAVAFKVDKLSPTRVHCISPSAPREAIERFKEAHPDWYITNDGKICVNIERKIKDTVKFMREKILELWNTELLSEQVRTKI